MSNHISSGQQLADQGIMSVAKISLWISQENNIKELFEYSESRDYIWHWSETRYSAEDKRGLEIEVSFVYFLKDKEIKEFKSGFPDHLAQLLHFEAFNSEIYDYYHENVEVTKHPKTP